MNTSLQIYKKENISFDSLEVSSFKTIIPRMGTSMYYMANALLSWNLKT